MSQAEAAGDAPVAPPKPPRRWSGLPIAVQILALLIGGLVAAQVVTVLVVLALPAPRAPVYRIADVTAAFQGGSLQPPYGQPLTLSQQHKPPRPPLMPGRMAEPIRRELAQALRVPESRVRVVLYPPNRLFSLARGRRRDWPRDRPGGGGRPFAGAATTGATAEPAPGAGPTADEGPDAGLPPTPPAAGTPAAGAGQGPGSGPGRGFFRRGEPPIVGDFAAALQLPSGAWSVLRPAPEPFPNDWQKRVLLWFLGCLAVVTPAGYLFARRITAPIGAFARAADRLGRDPGAEAMHLSGPAEIGMAARAFNDMQVRLKRYVEDRTGMVGAISHDLRTPLARMRFKLENAPPELRDPVLSDVEQMERMITAVLSFIRGASAPNARERIDLLSLLECVVDDAAGTGADVSIEPGFPITVEADALALQRLFENLVDNAVKYGGRASLRLFEDKGEAVVEIADAGPGLKPADMARVFEPFYRAEAARTLDGGGVGLGLAVARSIARAHGGDVTLASAPSGLTARVSLPLPPGAPKR
jgi:two-component system OmpR family sensor kinase